MGCADWTFFPIWHPLDRGSSSGFNAFQSLKRPPFSLSLSLSLVWLHSHQSPWLLKFIEYISSSPFITPSNSTASLSLSLSLSLHGIYSNRRALSFFSHLHHSTSISSSSPLRFFVESWGLVFAPRLLLPVPSSGKGLFVNGQIDFW